MSDEILLIGKDNYIERTLYTVDQTTQVKTLFPNVDSATTRAVLALVKNDIVAKTFDSAVESALFDWTIGGSKIRFKLGTHTFFDTKAGINYSAILVLFDAINTNGIQFAPFTLTVARPKV